MIKFTSHTGRVAVLDRCNVDTDQIIPKNFLKKIGKLGYGDDVFHNWRYLENGRENPDFALNRDIFRPASILLTRSNFGCGSSREHAVWALMQFGFKVIVGAESRSQPSFADIFRTNAMKNGLLTVSLPEETVSKWIEVVCAEAPIDMTVDLKRQTLTLNGGQQKLAERFDFPAHEKERFLKGLDEISLSLKHEKDILAFEKTHDAHNAISPK